MRKGRGATCRDSSRDDDQVRLFWGDNIWAETQSSKGPSQADIWGKSNPNEGTNEYISLEGLEEDTEYQYMWYILTLVRHYYYIF